MSLPDVLLSLLREPMSGTDLIRLFKGTINHFWQTDLSQVYRALEGLEREGCLTSESVPSRRGPARRVYRLTADGRSRLSDWIRRPARIPAVKLEYLAQLFSATADDQPAERAREVLLSMRGEAAAGVLVLERIDELMRGKAGGPKTMPDFLFYPWLTLQHGLLRRRALLDWIDASLAHLEARPAGGEGADARGEAGADGMTEMVEAMEKLAEDTGEAGPHTKKKGRET